jgi:hypothetical protein
MAVPLVLLSIGVAHADSNDDDFVQQVNNIGIIGPPGNLINPDGAANFVSLSVTHYCPGH